jgi:single-strand DNA-binding protein
MAALNQCSFIGNVGKAPEIRVTGSGTKVAKFSLAVTKKFKDRAGNAQEKTEWIPLVAWDKKAETIERLVGKGDPLFVSTEFSLKTWDGPDGSKKSAPEFLIVDFQFLKPKGSSSSSSGGGSDYGSGGGYGGGATNYGGGDVPPDDLPF